MLDRLRESTRSLEMRAYRPNANAIMPDEPRLAFAFELSWALVLGGITSAQVIEELDRDGSDVYRHILTDVLARQVNGSVLDAFVNARFLRTKLRIALAFSWHGPIAPSSDFGRRIEQVSKQEPDPFASTRLRAPLTTVYAAPRPPPR